MLPPAWPSRRARPASATGPPVGMWRRRIIAAQVGRRRGARAARGHSQRAAGSMDLAPRSGWRWTSGTGSRRPVWMAGGTPEHLLGTDQVGRDLLSRVIYGGRVSLIVGVSAVLLSSSRRHAPRARRGLLRGRLDWTIMTVRQRRVLTFPFVLLALAVIAVLGPEPAQHDRRCWPWRAGPSTLA